MTALDTATGQAGELVEPITVVQPLTLGSMFWRPAYLERSAWLEHIPFAFWLIEAHRPKVFVELGSHHGTSYFAFCQAVEKLGLATQCFAVDTWKGDEHAGFYDEKIFAKVKAHNDSQYSGFSRLVRSTFDEALGHFTDGTIDLLHIDGLHTIEAVRHDFQTWLPKLSDNAVVIMHDTNVRERKFGVFQLFEELSQRYPSFNFVHGHGLGVLGVGKKQSPLLERFYQASKSESITRSIQSVFSRLGRACGDAFLAAEQQSRATQLSDEVNKHKKQLEEFKTTLDKTKADLATRSKDLTETRNKLQAQVEKSALERGQLEERANLFKELRAELREEVVKLQAKLDAFSDDHRAKAEEVAKLQHANLIHQEQAERMAKGIQERLEQERQQHANQLDAERKEFAAQLSAVRNEAEARIAHLNEQARSQQSALKLELANARASLDKIAEADAQNGVLVTEIDRLQASVSALSTRNGALEQLVQAAELRFDSCVRERDAAIEAQVAATHQHAQARAELLTLRTRLSGAEEELAAMSDAGAELSRQLANAKAELAAETDRLKTCRQERDSARAQRTQALQRGESLDAEIKGLRTKLGVAEGELDKAKREAADAAKTVLKLNAERSEQVAALMKERDRLSLSLEQRFNELAKLTRLLDEANKPQAREGGEASKSAGAQPVIAQATEPHPGLKGGKQRSRFGSLFSNSSRGKRRKLDGQLIKEIQLLRSSPFFQSGWYLDRYPDVRANGVDPVEHYVRFGAAEGRDPGPRFCTSNYLAAHTDVAGALMNPLVHYILHGEKEGRRIVAAEEVVHG